jgi:hypothetical protein
MALYRDDRSARRAQLASLERAVEERASAHVTLRLYLRELLDEQRRLEHAIVWYENGHRYGFNRFKKRDRLDPATQPSPRLRGLEERIRALESVDDREIEARLLAATRRLAAADPVLVRLEEQASSLRAHNDRLRADVEAWAARYPDHPPPPEYDVGRGMVVAIGGALLGLTAFSLLLFGFMLSF